MSHRDDKGFLAMSISLLSMFAGVMILLSNYKPVDTESESTGIRNVQQQQQRK